MGRSATEARGALRLSLGWASTAADIDAILRALGRVRARVLRRSEEAAWPAHGS
jgi:cysteine sulfinate desulfinase/cysteine desulfurase-like protein